MIIFGGLRDARCGFSSQTFKTSVEHVWKVTISGWPTSAAARAGRDSRSRLSIFGNRPETNVGCDEKEPTVMLLLENRRQYIGLAYFK